MSICIVYFSVDGHAPALAEAIAKGCTARLFDVTALNDADWRALGHGPMASQTCGRVFHGDASRR